jgi:hypothetical protein
MKFSEAKSYDDIIKSLLDINQLKHEYYHYTSISCYENMIRSNKIELTRGNSLSLNDLLEKFKCADESIWKRLYIACFTYERDESIALWQCYGRPLAQAIRIELDGNNIAEISQRKEQNIYKVNIEDKNNRYDLLNGIEFEDICFTGVSYWEYRTKSPFLYFKGQYLQSSKEFNIDYSYTAQSMVGKLKNIAWKHEKEFRILAILPQGLEEYPDRIAIEAKDLWSNPKQILCGPCMDKNVLKTKFPQLNILDSEVKFWVNIEKECVYCEKMHALCNKKSNEKTNDIHKSFGVLG